MHGIHPLRFVCVAALVVLVSACSFSPPAGRDGSWTEVEREALSPQQLRQLQTENNARQALFSRLVERLTDTIHRDGFPGAIDVCAREVPEIRRDVRRKYGVEIGRTSFRLRNPDNKSPDWARPYVEKRVEKPVVLRGEDDSLAVLTPIHLKPLCANCHGPEDQLAPGVKQALEKQYPEDRATGFETGDLRGWFWVKVSPASNPP